MVKSLNAILFPEINRTFWGKRWIKVVLLNIHLCGVCGYVGGRLFHQEVAVFKYFLILTIISGLMLIAIELFSNFIWLFQNRGWMILAKTALLSLIPFTAPHEGMALLGIVFISGWISHAKGNFRYYSILHGRRIERMDKITD